MRQRLLLGSLSDAAMRPAKVIVADHRRITILSSVSGCRMDTLAAMLPCRFSAPGARGQRGERPPHREIETRRNRSRPPVSDSSASIPFIDGALHLIWKGQGSGTGGGLPPPSHLTAAAASHGETETFPDGEDLMSRAVEHLGPRELKAFKKAKGVRTSPPVVHQMTRGTVTSARGTGVATPVSRTSRGARPVAGSTGTAKVKLARDAARLRALCVVTHNKPFGVPASFCKPARVSDHR